MFFVNNSTKIKYFIFILFVIPPPSGEIKHDSKSQPILSIFTVYIIYNVGSIKYKIRVNKLNFIRKYK